MMEILTKTPIFVWPLLAYLLYIGNKARKTSSVPLIAVLMMPAAFLSWSLYSIVTNYFLWTISVWVLCLIAGAMIGFWITIRKRLNVDRQARRIEMPGSLLPLVLSMSIFSLKYGIGMTSGLHPELIGTVTLLIPELLATTIMGVFAGRAAACVKKFFANIA